MTALKASLLCLAVLVRAAVAEEKLQIGVKFRPETCDRKVEAGDKVYVHYRGTLTDGTEFDNSYDRGEAFEFTVGAGQVIEGWDLGMVGACLGEKRKLKIPSRLGYGKVGAPPKIPADASLIFEVEIKDIKRPS